MDKKFENILEKMEAVRKSLHPEDSVHETILSILGIAIDYIDYKIQKCSVDMSDECNDRSENKEAYK